MEPEDNLPWESDPELQDMSPMELRGILKDDLSKYQKARYVTYTPRPATSLLQRNFLSWPRNFRAYITFYAEFKKHG